MINYINNNDYENLLNKVKVNNGEFYPIQSGTIHALGKNIVLLEIQQSSDVTYRFYDYHRKDKNGNERPLHIKKAIDVTSYVPYNEKIINCFNDNICDIWDNKYFKVSYYEVDGLFTLENQADYLIVSIINGNIEVLDYSLSFPNSFIVTSLCKKLTIKGKGVIIVTTPKVLV